MSLTLEEIEKDGFLRPFTTPNFNISTHVSSLLTTSISTSLTQLSNSISSVEQQIHAIVTTHHGDLLAQTTNVERMEAVVQNCSQRALACLSSVDKLKCKLDDLYTQCSEHVRYLENLYQTNAALRRVRAVMEIDRKAQTETNTAEVAACVVQIEYLCGKSPQLTTLRPYLDKATSLRQNIEKQTENMLNQGINAGSLSQVTSSLQIFINLNILDGKLTKVFSDIENIVERDVKTALEIKVLSTKVAGASGPGRAQVFTNPAAVKQIWLNLQTLSSKLLIHANKVKLMWRAVLNGKDLISNLPFLSFLTGDDATWQKFWNNFMDILIRHFSAVNVEYVKVAFENDFPRLLSVFSSLGIKIEEGCDSLSVVPNLRGVISNYEKAYLSKSLARLFESVNHTFSSIPSNAEVNAVLKLIKAEMQVEDTMLKKLVSRNVGKTVHLVCVRAEQLVSNDGSSTQVIGPATDSQIANARLLNALEYFKTEMGEPCEAVDTLLKNSIHPLILAIGDAVEAILQTMQHENFKRTNRATEYSLYIGELQSFISRSAKDYFSLFKSTDLIQNCGANLATRTIELFTRHVSLLPVLTQENTKTQILTDLNHLEVVVAPICPVLSELGRPYKLLKGFKSLLALKVEEFASSNLIGSVVPFSLALHLMFMFSQGEPRLPHLGNNWSITRYSKWLDEHTSEADRFEMLKKTLEAYVQSVTQKGQKEFAPIYPHMISVLQKGMLGC